MKMTFARLLVVVLALCVGGCTEAPGPAGTIPDPAAPTPKSGAAPEGALLSTENARVAAGEHIVFSGRSTLPEGSRLRTQLLADGEPESWWPSDAWVVVRNGSWQLTVPLGNGSAPTTLDPETQYSFRVWHEDGSPVAPDFHFDLLPPPASGE